MNVLAGIVTFNPELDRLKLNIEHIVGQVNEVVIFDNGSKNIEDISYLCSMYSTVNILISPENVGIAAALNRIVDYCLVNKYEWLLTLDQDTVCPDNMISKYEPHLKCDNVALICPKLIDKRKTILESQDNNTLEVEEIDSCETSGTLMNLELCKTVGWFEEILFIDYVDFEYCKRLIVNGYKILRINSVILDQEFGVVVPSKFSDFYLTLSEMTKINAISKLSYNSIYSSFRCYYCTRNRIYYLIKYHKYLNMPKEILETLKIYTRVLFRGQQKIQLLKSILRGFYHGLKMPVSSYENK